MSFRTALFKIPIPENLTLHEAVSAIYLTYTQKTKTGDCVHKGRYTIKWSGSKDTPHLNIYDLNRRTTSNDNLTFEISALPEGLMLKVNKPFYTYSFYLLGPLMFVILVYTTIDEGLTKENIYMWLILLATLLSLLGHTRNYGKEYRQDIIQILLEASQKEAIGQ